MQASAARSSLGDRRAKSEDISTLRSTERQIEAMRLTSLTAGPMTVKSSRSWLPILP
jgi:hypothetical protein